MGKRKNHMDEIQKVKKPKVSASLREISKCLGYCKSDWSIEYPTESRREVLAANFGSYNTKRWVVNWTLTPKVTIDAQIKENLETVIDRKSKCIRCYIKKEEICRTNPFCVECEALISQEGLEIQEPRHLVWPQTAQLTTWYQKELQLKYAWISDLPSRQKEEWAENNGFRFIRIFEESDLERIDG